MVEKQPQDQIKEEEPKIGTDGNNTDELNMKVKYLVSVLEQLGCVLEMKRQIFDDREALEHLDVLDKHLASVDHMVALRSSPVKQIRERLSMLNRYVSTNVSVQITAKVKQIDQMLANDDYLKLVAELEDKFVDAANQMVFAEQIRMIREKMTNLEPQLNQKDKLKCLSKFGEVLTLMNANLKKSIAEEAKNREAQKAEHAKHMEALDAEYAALKAKNEKLKSQMEMWECFTMMFTEN